MNDAADMIYLDGTLIAILTALTVVMLIGALLSPQIIDLLKRLYRLSHTAQAARSEIAELERVYRL